jgi:glycosyltransferase involved in cell wall biosynthesis
LHEPFDNREGLERAMAQLDAFVLFTTHREGLPLTLLEAMSAGVPWIAADRGGIRDLVVDNTCTILLPSPFTYQDAFAATKHMAQSVRHGLIRSEILTLEYRNKFHPDYLTGQWRGLLFAAPASM